MFPSRIDYLGHLNTRQYARLVDEWVATMGLDIWSTLIPALGIEPILNFVLMDRLMERPKFHKKFQSNIN